jgi:hypothetical protein
VGFTSAAAEFAKEVSAMTGTLNHIAVALFMGKSYFPLGVNTL